MRKDPEKEFREMTSQEKAMFTYKNIKEQKQREAMAREKQNDMYFILKAGQYKFYREAKYD